MEKALVVINKGHSLFPQQRELLNTQFGEEGWGFHFVPEEGWTYDEQVDLARDWVVRYVARDYLDEEDSVKEGFTFVFASPVPALLMVLSKIAGKTVDMEVMVFHNDHRVAREIPDGKGGKRIIHTVAPDGWQLV